MSTRRTLALIAAACAVISMVLMGIVILTVATTQFGSVRIDAARTIRGDLDTTSARVDVLGAVRGDLNARALFLRQVGRVDGDVTVVAGRAELRGPIGGSVHAYGGSVSLYGVVDGNVEVYGGQLTVVEEAVINGDLIVHGGSVMLVAHSYVAGNVRGEAARVTIEGEIDGDVNLSVWRLTLAPGAIVRGSLRYESRTNASIADSASVFRTTLRVDPADRFPAGGLLFWHAAAIPRYLVMIVIGVVLVLVAPDSMAAIADEARRNLATAVLNGLAVITFGPLLLTTLGLFVVTLPVVTVAGLILVLAMYVSMAVVGLTIGRMALRRCTQGPGRTLDILAICLGITALALIRIVPVPSVDLVVAVATAITGVGAMLVRAEGSHRTRRPRARRPVASFVGGAVAGSLIVSLAVLAIVAAGTGTLAALASLSHSALFTWEVAPKRLAATTLVLAGASLIIVTFALVSRIRGRSRVTER